MYDLNYALQYEDGRPFLREYVYHIGSFHYNWHKEIELLCVLTGQVEVCSEGNVYELEADDLLLINANVGHATLSRAVDSRIMLLRLDPSFLKKGCPDFEKQHIELYSGASTRNERRFVEIRRCMAQMMLSHFSSNPVDIFAFESAINQLALSLLRDFPLTRQLSVAYSDKGDAKNVYEMIQYLEAEYRERITLQDIAARWSYAPNYASGLFKEYVGINFYDYLTRIRLRQATRSLSETNARISDIAAEHGFQDLKSFNTKFREIFGRSPSEYRKSLRDEHIRYDATFKQSFVRSDDQAAMDRITAYCQPQPTPETTASPKVTPRRNQNAINQAKELRALADRIIEITGELTLESE